MAKYNKKKKFANGGQIDPLTGNPILQQGSQNTIGLSGGIGYAQQAVPAILDGVDLTTSKGDFKKADNKYISGELKSAGVGALTGAASGAMVGGPIGAGIGAAIGGVSGFLSQRKQDKSQWQSEEEAKMIQNQQLLSDSEQMKRDTGQYYAMGGNLTEYQGETHENGGIQIANNEVETGETRGPSETPMENYIYSDRLKVPGKKYTFAKASKFIENKYSKRDGDKLSDEQKERELLNLMNTQEDIRQKMITSVYKKAFGGELDSLTLNGSKDTINRDKSNTYPVYQLINGVPSKGYVNTDLNSFNKLDRSGLNMINSVGLQSVPQSELDSMKGTANYYKPYNNIDSNINKNSVIPQSQYRITQDKSGNKYYWKGVVPITESEYLNSNNKFANGGTLDEINDINKQYQGGQYDVLNRNLYNPSANYNNLNAAGNFLGSGYDIYRGLKGPDKVNYDRVNPDLVDYSASRDLVRKDIQTGFANTANNLKGVNSPAQYLNLITQVAANRDQSIADNVTKSKEGEINMNSQIRNQSKYANAQIQKAEADARMQEKDVASNTLSTGLYNAGSAIAQLGNDKKAYVSQSEAKKLIGSSDYSYEYDKNGKIKGVKFNKTGVITPIK